MSRETFDAVVVGSGAGGGAAAYALTQAGFRVCLLEKGPHYKSEDFFHDELAVCRRDYFVPSPLDEPHTIVRSGQTAAERTTDGWIACCVGGGTVHMSGYSFRLHREDLRLRSLYGQVRGADAADWPIAYEDLEPHYDEVERVIGISGDAAANPREPRRGPFPLAPLLAHPASALVEAGARKLGLSAFPTPRAILSADYNGRPACRYCGFCAGYGCEVAAKSSSLVTFLALAAETGRLTLRPRAMVTKIRRGGATWLDDKGAMHETRARVVILACSSIETARLLLASGIGNSSGLVGKNLIFAGLATGWARFSAPSPHWPPGASALPFIDRSVQDLYIAKDAPHPKAGTILFNAPNINPIGQLERLANRGAGEPPLFGAALKRRLREFYADTRTIEWEAFSEFLPHGGCDVSLDPDVKDRFGLPVARLRAALHPTSLAVSEYLAARARDVLAAAGAVSSGTDVGERMYFVLQAGTARMGTDPRTSVTNRDGQLHDTKNVYIADASTFPSGGAAPFTMTIMANALRIGQGIAARGKRGEL